MLDDPVQFHIIQCTIYFSSPFLYSIAQALITLYQTESPISSQGLRNTLLNDLQLLKEKCGLLRIEVLDVCRFGKAYYNNGLIVWQTDRRGISIDYHTLLETKFIHVHYDLWKCS